MFFLRALPDLDMISRYSKRPETARTIRDALVMLRDASVLLRCIDRYFAGHGLSQLQFLILVVIDREPERTSLRQSEIGERLDVSKPVLHRTTKTLIKAGLLRSDPDKEDGRAEQLTLTPQAAHKLQEVIPGYFRLIADFMQSPADTAAGRVVR
ncbi:MAG: MarR family transcriptional regulator [Pseudomonadota bacterium]